MRNGEIALGHLRLVPFRELIAHGEAVRIGGKALELLSVLAKSEGALVTKDELMEAVWPGVVVEENAIHVHIASLRKAMGAEADRLRVVRGLGYRLKTDPADAVSGLPDIGRADPRPVVAVLAFDGNPDAPETQYFADGISEEILLSVGRISGIRVIARTSSFQFRGADKVIGRIAAELRATHILDGSVRQTGDRVRVGVELVEAAGETVIWSGRFDHPVSEFGALQNEIANSVATALKEQFVAETAPAYVNPVAFDPYLKARALAGPRETRSECIRLFEQAVAIDPGFTRAWAELAVTRGIAARWDERTEPFDSAAEKVRYAASKALEIDPKCASAHVALGFLEPVACYRRFERHLEHAESFAPNDVTVMIQRTFLEYTVGHVKSAFRFASESYQMDPLNVIAYQNYANLLADVGFYDESLEAFIAAHKRWPGYWWLIGVPLLRAAMRRDWVTVDAIKPVAEAANLPGLALPQFVVLALRSPDAEIRQQVIAMCEEQFVRMGYLDLSTLVFSYNYGLEDETFSWIERSDMRHLFRRDGGLPDEKGFMLGTIFSDANIKMRRDARFVDLCRKIGLCDYWLETGKWPDCANDPNLGYDFRALTAASQVSARRQETAKLQPL